MKKIIAFDFDGTLAKTDYPTILEPKHEVIEAAKRLKENGNTIILYTCRHDADLDAAIEFCAEHGLVFDYVNENVPENIEKFGDCRKIFADLYIDDRARPVEFIELAMIKE